MADRYFNPFQAIDINVPVEFHEALTGYSQSGGSTSIDESPFPRMIDFWFLALCVAAREKLKPRNFGKDKTKKIIGGSIFGNDPWRVHVLMLIAIGTTGDTQIVSEPIRMIAVANELAIAGLPRVIDMLNDGSAEPIWNLSDALDTLLRKEKAV